MLGNTISLIIKILMNRHKHASKRQQHKQMMIQLFGKTRYYLSYWFGPWVLYTHNTKDYSTFDFHPYQKFYKDEKVAMRYAKKQQQKYKKVEITKVYDRKGQQIGFMLSGYCKIEQPDNVVKIKKGAVQ